MQRLDARNRRSAIVFAATAIAMMSAFVGFGCGGSGASGPSGKIAIDGSSTVFPLAQAAAEEFQAQNRNMRVTVGESGTGGGFEKFCAGEIDIANASRPISDEETANCKRKGIDYREIQVANDGIAVVTNPAMQIKCLTIEQLHKIWDRGSAVQSLGQVVDGASTAKLHLYGPGTDSGTFDYFTSVINGDAGRSRTDYQPSEDDNVLVQGVSGDTSGLGYFGFSYFEQNAEQLNLVAIDGGDGCILPSTETIQDGTYKPLSRPIYMYVSDDALVKKPAVKDFLRFTLDNYLDLAEIAEVVPMSETAAVDAKQALNAAQ